MVRSNRSLVRDQEHYCRTEKVLRLPGCSDNVICSSPQSNRPSSMVQSRYRRKGTHHSDLDARHATVNQHQLACVSIMPRLFQKTAVVVCHVRTLLEIYDDIELHAKFLGLVMFKFCPLWTSFGTRSSTRSLAKAHYRRFCKY